VFFSILEFKLINHPLSHTYIAIDQPHSDFTAATMNLLSTAIFVLVFCVGCAHSDEFIDSNALYIEKYVKEHADVVRLPSGALYRVVKEGVEGAPRVTDGGSCMARYVGTSITGAVFISSRKKGSSPSEITPSEITLPGTYTHTHAYMHAHINIQANIYIHIYICMHIFTYY
jgi:hypothetical protein